MANTPASSSIRILCTNGLKTVFEAIGPDLERNGIRFAANYGSTAKFTERVMEGDTPDIIILTDEAIDKLIAAGRIAGKRIDLARSFVGVAVRKGTPRPDIGSADAFIQTLREAKAIACSRLGASGQHFRFLLDKFGLAQELAPKITADDGYAGGACADGKADIAIQQISELMPVAGLDIVGPLPDEIQKNSIFSAGIGAGTAQQAAAEAFIARVKAGGYDRVLRDKGLEPAASPP
jgi:molybdate transport system substrate-binding protein